MRSGSGNRRARSSRGREGMTARHAFTVGSHPPPGQLVFRVAGRRHRHPSSLRISTTTERGATGRDRSLLAGEPSRSGAAVPAGYRLAVQEHADRADARAPVVVAHLSAVRPAPADVDRTADGDALEKAPSPENGVLAPQCDHPPGELKQNLVLMLPVQPGDLVVLAVGVVVAVLRPAGL